MGSNSKDKGRQASSVDEKKTKVSGNTNGLDSLSRQAEKERTRKPGSQSNSSKQGNNGRGGGK